MTLQAHCDEITVVLRPSKLFSMKFLVIAVAFAMFVSAQALTEAQKELVKANSKKCIGSTGVDTALIQKIRAGDFDFHDDKMNNYVFCMLKKSGLMNDEGVFNKDAALSKVGDDIKDIVSKAIDACLGETGATKEEKSFNYIKCYHKERPNHDIV